MQTQERREERQSLIDTYTHNFIESKREIQKNIYLNCSRATTFKPTYVRTKKNRKIKKIKNEMKEQTDVNFAWHLNLFLIITDNIKHKKNCAIALCCASGALSAWKCQKPISHAVNVKTYTKANDAAIYGRTNTLATHHTTSRLAKTECGHVVCHFIYYILFL